VAGATRRCVCVEATITTEQEDETTAETPSEQEQAALEILFHEPHRERIRLTLGRLGDSEVAFIVYAAPASETAESGSERIFPLAVLLGEEHLPYVDVSQSPLPAPVMIAATEAARTRARKEAEALEAQAARLEELIVALEATRRAENGRPRK
jgi:hypothetical protein